MKTRLSVACIMLLIMWNSYSQVAYRPVTPDEANAVAVLQISGSGKSHDHQVTGCREISNNNSLLAFTVDLDPAGYVVVPALTALPPVIAYSFESCFGDTELSNPLFSLIVSDLTLRMEYLSIDLNEYGAENQHSWNQLLKGDYGDRLFEQWPATGDGWLKTNWTQSPPYNDLCPMDPVTGQRSYAGCPATAMAQVLNFHKTINDTRFDDADDYYHNYAGRQYWIDDDHEYADFPSFPELNGCLDTLAMHYNENAFLTSRDKAALTFACGVAATQVYTSQGSGTFGVNQAFEAYQRFGFDESELLDASAIDLFDRLSQNIKDTMPAHLAIVDQNWSTGHNVVVDGYNTDEYYHLNFGWGGSYNGWYLVPQELPYNLTVIEGVVLDIKKQTLTGIAMAVNKPETCHLYPNPFSEFIYFESPITTSGPVTLQIFDQSGKCMFSVNVKEIRPSYRLTTEDLPPGTYLYSIRSAGQEFSGKVIKFK